MYTCFGVINGAVKSEAQRALIAVEERANSEEYTTIINNMSTHIYFHLSTWLIIINESAKILRVSFTWPTEIKYSYD